MPLIIVRNDITKMKTEAIVNTANEAPVVGTGCDSAVYKAAGYDKLLAYRKEKVGRVEEGEVFITPAFDLEAKYIIHAVSPRFQGGEKDEEKKLRSCYKKSLSLAREKGITSIAFPLISTGSFGYPKEEGMRIAVDEINAFLLENEMEVFLAVFDDKATQLGGKIYPDLDEYIDRNYVEIAEKEEYRDWPRRQDSNIRNRFFEKEHYERLMTALPDGISESTTALPDGISESTTALPDGLLDNETVLPDGLPDIEIGFPDGISDYAIVFDGSLEKSAAESAEINKIKPKKADEAPPKFDYDDFIEEHESALKERMKHLSDTFSEYLMYLIQEKGLENSAVWKRAIIDRKVFSKIKSNADYHPNKKTALCLCIGAMLNLDEARDLLARAGYALSPCDKTDIIFSYFIENEIYDMIELDIHLEEHGEPCLIS